MAARTIEAGKRVRPREHRGARELPKRSLARSGRRLLAAECRHMASTISRRDTRRYRAEGSSFTGQLCRVDHLGWTNPASSPYALQDELTSLLDGYARNLDQIVTAPSVPSSNFSMHSHRMGKRVIAFSIRRIDLLPGRKAE
jgi:hypothetical protein